MPALTLPSFPPILQWLGDLHVLDLSPLMRLCAPPPVVAPGPSTLLGDLGRLLLGSGIEALDALEAAVAAAAGGGGGRYDGRHGSRSAAKRARLSVACGAPESSPPASALSGAAPLVRLQLDGAGGTSGGDLDVLSLLSRWPASTNPHNGDSSALLAPASLPSDASHPAGANAALEEAVVVARAAFEAEMCDGSAAAHPLADYAPFLAAFWGDPEAAAAAGEGVMGSSASLPQLQQLLGGVRRRKPSPLSPLLVPPARARLADAPLGVAGAGAEAFPVAAAAREASAEGRDLAAQGTVALLETAPRGGDAAIQQQLYRRAAAGASGGEPTDPAPLLPSAADALSLDAASAAMVSPGSSQEFAPPGGAASGAASSRGGSDPASLRPLPHASAGPPPLLPHAATRMRRPDHGGIASDPRSVHLQSHRLPDDPTGSAAEEAVVPQARAPMAPLPPDKNACAMELTLRTSGLVAGVGYGAAGLASPPFADVTLVACGVRLRLHRVVLAARSEFFARMLSGGFAEAAAPLHHSCNSSSSSSGYGGASDEAIDLGPDLHPGAVAALLRYAYTDVLPAAFPALSARSGGGPDVPLLLALLELAERWAMGRASLLCQAALARLMREENAAGLLEVADRLQVR